MGEPDSVWEERIRLLWVSLTRKSWSVIQKIGNPAGVKFLHCLPAFHNRGNKNRRGISTRNLVSTGWKSTEDVFESQHSIVFEEVENRLHTIKVVMVATLGSI